MLTLIFIWQDMKSAQARASVETLREVQNDKALKTKAEKERRLRKVSLSVVHGVRVPGDRVMQ